MNIFVCEPLDHTIRERIEKTVELVLINGPSYELELLSKNLKEFEFLKAPVYSIPLDQNGNEHLYYKWKYHSMFRNEHIYDWGMDPIKLEGIPNLVHPPPLPFPSIDYIEKYTPNEPLNYSFNQNNPKNYASLKRPISSDDSDSDVERLRLSPQKQMHLHKLLLNQDLSKHTIGKTMLFCILNARYARQILNIITSSLFGKCTFKRTIDDYKSGFYLLNDLLFNCNSFRDSWKYKQEIELRLSFLIQRSVEITRLNNVNLKQLCMEMLDLWSSKSYFKIGQIQELKALFYPPKKVSRVDKDTIKANSKFKPLETVVITDNSNQKRMSKNGLGMSFGSKKQPMKFEVKLKDQGRFLSEIHDSVKKSTESTQKQEKVVISVLEHRESVDESEYIEFINYDFNQSVMIDEEVDGIDIDYRSDTDTEQSDEDVIKSPNLIALNETDDLKKESDIDDDVHVIVEKGILEKEGIEEFSVIPSREQKDFTVIPLKDDTKEQCPIETITDMFA
jgi:hypothetical protein